ncbi:hypothetical protein F4678DRAFT_451277 [Xylaria arbuscula]|nr:hypothetical protein F4678DRAFT_451277 [Xylaria arbuscula]
MPVPNHSVAPVTKDDIPTVSGFLQDSKLHLAINRFLIKDWPNFSFQNVNYARAIEGSLSNPQSTSLKVVNDTSGKIVAYICYTKRPSGPVKHEKLDPEGDESLANEEVPDGFVPDVYRAVMNADKELEPNLNTDEYISLTYLYVEPSSRRQGIGSWLFQIAQEAALAQNLPLTLFSEPNHHDFFVNRGFGDVKKVDIDLREWAAALSGYGVFRVTRMVRDEH